MSLNIINVCMKYDLDLLNLINKHYDKQKVTFSKIDEKALTGKDSFKGKTQGFLTLDYHRRNKLIKSPLTYAYTFREIQNKDDEDLVLTYVLYSPERYFKEDASRYKDIAFKLNELLTFKKVKDKKLRNLYLCLTRNDIEAKYIEIPEPYNLNHLVFVSSVFLRRDSVHNFHLGVNVVFASLDISKEILYVPFKYLPEVYKQGYEEEYKK